MGKRKLVPAALHSELTEYSSLIRALRASNSLDVASHLAKASFNSDSKLDSILIDADDNDSQHEVTGAEDEYDTDTMTNAYPPRSSAVPSRGASPSQESRSSSTFEGSPTSRAKKRKRQSASSPPQRRRDAWTRWPLLVDDMHMPEWSFEDEIGYLAERILKCRSRTSLPSREEGKDDKNHDEYESGDTDYVDPLYLAQASSNYLSTILALLVAHTPNRPDSQQNRVEPMGWRTVLDVLSSCGDPNVADPKMLSSVKMRMESLYSTYETTEEPDSDSLGRSHLSGTLGPTNAAGSLVTHRVQSSLTAKQKLKSALSSPLDSLLSFPDTPEGWTPPRPTRLSVRKVRKTVVKTPVYIEDEEF